MRRGRSPALSRASSSRLSTRRRSWSCASAFGRSCPRSHGAPGCSAARRWHRWACLRRRVARRIAMRRRSSPYVRRRSRTCWNVAGGRGRLSPARPVGSSPWRRRSRRRRPPPRPRSARRWWSARRRACASCRRASGCGRRSCARATAGCLRRCSSRPPWPRQSPPRPTSRSSWPSTPPRARKARSATPRRGGRRRPARSR
mmetsp:Transcript_18898/g.53280  ORF Transcript_18898/g.53280 Transcript_18898/m.53280 type:complete len:201 (-) Transcript_18898:2127-2729(-)